MVHQFDNQCEFYHAGFYPRLLEWSDGYLYGVCIDGGGSGGTNGGGAAFRVARDGSGFQVLHGFATPPPGGVAGITLQPGGDGSHPESPLVPGTDGYFYGTTLEGGAHHNGTIYRMRPDGSGYQLLYSFPAFNLIPLGSVANAQGGSPIGDVAFGGDGKLYGTTAQGGNNGTGVIWSFTPPAP